MKKPPCCPLRPHPLSLLSLRQLLFLGAGNLSAASHSCSIWGSVTCGCGFQTDPVIESSSHSSTPEPLLTQTSRERTVSQVMPGIQLPAGWVEPINLGSKVISTTYWDLGSVSTTSWPPVYPAMSKGLSEPSKRQR